MPDPRATEYTVKVRLPGTDETRVSSFPTDIEAVRFMERAVRQGATVVECRNVEGRVA